MDPHCRFEIVGIHVGTILREIGLPDSTRFGNATFTIGESKQHYPKLRVDGSAYTGPKGLGVFFACARTDQVFR
ncbi:hypothetical protein GCM10007937_58350 [Mesorhizobium albiziae]|nr:hypothetical protein GCM10007937_58350 [Mesorhizobium albiziae]